MDQPRNDHSGALSAAFFISLAMPVLVTVLAMVSSGCSAALAGELGRLQKLNHACPEGGKEVAGYVAVDVSGSVRPMLLAPDRIKVIQAVAEQTAVCGGHLRVTVFSSSASAEQVAFDGDLHAEGATANARLRKVPHLVSQAMGDIKAGLPKAAQSVPASGTDVISQLTLANEYGTSFGNRSALVAAFVTDGVSTTGESSGPSPSFTTTTAIELANSATVPSMKGAQIHITGVGRSNSPNPTAYVNALKAYLARVCTRTGATTCQINTDFTNLQEG